jgi:CDP-glucose 4,6-dehydratase
VGEVVRLFAQAWGPSAPEPVVEPSPLSEAGVLRLDSAKAAAGLGWRPALSLGEAVAMTAAWWRAYGDDPGGIAAFTRGQIARYEESAM